MAFAAGRLGAKDFGEIGTDGPFASGAGADDLVAAGAGSFDLGSVV